MAGPHVITCRATLDVPADTVRQVSRWLAAHRKTLDARPWQRAATPYVQAMVVRKPHCREMARVCHCAWDFPVGASGESTGIHLPPKGGTTA